MLGRPPASHLHVLGRSEPRTETCGKTLSENLGSSSRQMEQPQELEQPAETACSSLRASGGCRCPGTHLGGGSQVMPEHLHYPQRPQCIHLKLHCTGDVEVSLDAQGCVYM